MIIADHEPTRREIPSQQVSGIHWRGQTCSAVVLAYRAVFTRRSGTDVSEPEAMYVSSLWCRRDDRWVNLFSHDTPLPLA